jgi:Secretion system C-terminal sorting domain/Receptor L domain
LQSRFKFFLYNLQFNKKFKMQIIKHNNSKSIIFILTLLFTFNSSNIYSQCPPGDVELFTQDDVNAFVAAYPNCTTIDGYLYITGSDVVDLSGLSNISTINGYSGFALYVDNTGINNFNYFSNLINCPDIYLAYNSNLTNVNTFNLVSGPTNIKIEGNPLLQSINTLSNTTIENLDIIYNPVLTNLQGFGNSISGNISIIGNSQLSICNMGALCDFITTNGNNNLIINNNASGCNTFDDLWGSCTNVPYGVNLISPQNGSTNVSVSSALSWNTNPFATGYLLRVGTTLGGGNILNDLDVGNTTSHNLATNLPYLTTIFVRITPYNINGAGQLLNDESFITIGPPTCLPGGITFNTQAQIDAFPIDHPGCETIQGNVTVTGSSITNLDGISQIKNVEGNFTITGCTSLNDYSPISNLEVVNGNLYIKRVTAGDISGFNNLSYVGGNLSFVGNYPGIANINGFNHSNLVIGNSLQFNGPNIFSINGFNGVSYLKYLRFYQINGQSGVTGFQNLTSLSNSTNPPNLNGLIIQFTGISNLAFLSNLSSSFGNFKIDNNPLLSSITELSSLNSINGEIQLSYNANLSECEIQALCDRINPVTGIVSIYGNSSGCNSIPEVETECSTLSVNWLLQPNAKLLNNQTQITWSIAAQLNNAKYIIEHSKDGRTFSSIGEIAGDGTINETKHYEYIHLSPSIGINYYRIKQVDYDGQYSYSDIVSVFCKREGNDVSIYPNPSSNIINLNGADGSSYTIYDLVGRQVIDGQISDDAISIDHLSPGMYYLHLDSDSVKSVYKIWKE